MGSLKGKWPILALILIIFIFFWPLFLKGQLPIPSDAIVGLYHPFRDFYSQEYPLGIPFKNFLITDPVRQTFPWRELTVNLLKRGEIPFWNPYSLAGAPLLANFQSAVFYPLNTLFFFLPFALAWSLLILSAPLLASLFMYLYLRNLGISKAASFLGGFVFSLSGFFVAWLEWGTVLHSILWLPLILLSIDRMFASCRISSKSRIKNQKFLIWSLVFIFSLASSFFAGHLQVFFYVSLFSGIYLLARWWQHGRNRKLISLFIIHYSLFIILTAVQWLPTLQLISLSAREIDLDWQKPGWFIPVQHLAQFIAPDFFGNPATLNYFGVWNYAEFIGYIGILPLLLTFFAIFFRRDKKTLFFTSVTLIAFIFAVQNPISELPYRLNLPFLSTGQPTRLLGIIDFSMAVLAALGLDLFMKRINIKRLLSILGGLSLIFIILWIVAIFNNFDVSKKNLILPTALFVISAIIMVGLLNFQKRKTATLILCCTLVVIVTFDLLRFAEKFTPFTKKEYLFPKTKTIEFLKNKEKEEGPFRFMTTDNRIFPPNFSIIYRLQTVDGYDPLYLSHYGELIAASERGEPNINPPFGFNRIITPHKIPSKIIDLLNVKYILSLKEEKAGSLTEIFQEGETRVYQNSNVIARAFFVEEVKAVGDKQEAIKAMFASDFDPKKTAAVEDSLGVLSITPPRWKIGKAEIISYSENKVIINTENGGEGFLVLVDSFYPTWKATIDGVKTNVYRTNYNFRGIIVPQGRHRVEFYISLL